MVTSDYKAPEKHWLKNSPGDTVGECLLLRHDILCQIPNAHIKNGCAGYESPIAPCYAGQRITVVCRLPDSFKVKGDPDSRQSSEK